VACITLNELAVHLGAELRGEGGVEITGVAELSDAGPTEIAPLTDPARREQAATTRAAALIVLRPLPECARPQLICADPRRALGLAIERFSSAPVEVERGVDPRAAVASCAAIEEGAWVGPFAYVGAGAEIGAGSRVEPFSYVGAGARVGAGCRLGPGATLLDGCLVGDGVVLGPGAVVGSAGFGFFRDPSAPGGHRRVRGLGSVELGDGVDLGAGSCVDRGTLGATRVGRGAKIDNLVQIAHNVTVGEGALICAQAGVAGSAVLGAECVLGGQAGVGDHRRIGDRARIGGQAGVVQDVPAGAEVAGTPAIDRRRWLRASAIFARLADLRRELRRLLRDGSPGRSDDPC
jgi:UDP-3-O-[3-hydroxymyristoyl] glucosamine N-acyltransferase